MVLQGVVDKLRPNIKGSDRLCKVVELSIQCCGKNFFWIHFRRIKRFKDL